MTKVIGFAGSLRKRSYNRALLRAAVELAPDGLEIEVATIDGIPLYDGDAEERDGVPSAAQRLKERIAASDGVLIVTPEYNNSIPGVLKNALDWLTRPPDDIARVFGGRPVALIGATPGRGGTRFAQTAWLPIFRTLGMQPFFGKVLYVDSAKSLFDDEMRLTDEPSKQRLADYLAAFHEWLSKGARDPRGS